MRSSKMCYCFATLFAIVMSSSTFFSCANPASSSGANNETASDDCISVGLLATMQSEKYYTYRTGYWQTGLLRELDSGDDMLNIKVPFDIVRDGKNIYIAGQKSNKDASGYWLNDAWVSLPSFKYPGFGNGLFFRPGVSLRLRTEMFTALGKGRI